MTPDVCLADLGFSAETRADLSVDHLARLAATLDAPALVAGSPLPILWHWACFTPTTATGDLGDDGHPRITTAVLRSYPRRMWGAGVVEMTTPLRAGVPATRLSKVKSAKEVPGQTGALLVVRVEHIYRQKGAWCLTEEQTIIYRGSGDPVQLPEGDAEPSDGDGWRRRVVPDTRLLTRFSAVTFNTHRIHYDVDYARQVEGYPALVVHGPLAAMLVADGAQRDAGAPLSNLRFRASRPLFVGLPFVITGRLDGSAGEARITRNDGATAVDVTYQVDP